MPVIVFRLTLRCYLYKSQSSVKVFDCNVLSDSAPTIQPNPTVGSHSVAICCESSVKKALEQILVAFMLRGNPFKCSGPVYTKVGFSKTPKTFCQFNLAFTQSWRFQLSAVSVLPSLPVNYNSLRPNNEYLIHLLLCWFVKDVKQSRELWNALSGRLVSCCKHCGIEPAGSQSKKREHSAICSGCDSALYK